MSQTSPNDGQLFERKTLIALFAVGLLSFAGVIYLVVTSASSGQARTFGTSAFSDSAIGHHAFIELLRRLDVQVLVSRNNSAEKAWPDHLLLVAEPRPDNHWTALAADVTDHSRALVVLPKWRGRPDLDKRGWIADADFLSRSTVNAVFDKLLRDGWIMRSEQERTAWHGGFTSDPLIRQPQLIVGSDLVPLIWTDEGVLLGQAPYNEDLWILSDPDLLSNHGLGQGDNAVLAAEIIERLRGPDSTVVVDETIHGFLRVPNRLKVLFEFPLVIATLLGLVSLGLLAWTLSERFGAPHPGGPALPSGKEGLIDNTARLLEAAGHDRDVLRRYRQILLRDTARRLHAPRRLDEAALSRWFAAIEEARGSQRRIATILTELTAALRSTQRDRRRLLHLARELHHWREDLIDGSGSRTGAQR